MAAQTTPGNLVGAILARKYRLVSPIGEGGMGLVFAAETAEGKRFAAKLLRPEFVGDDQVRARFMEEANVCMRLVHPNVLRVFEVLQAEDGTPFFIMELLEGSPLSTYVQNGHRVPPAQAVPILQGILSGLGAAHAQGIVHRDLKPENIFLMHDPAGEYHVKLLDFGIAKVMDVAGGMGQKTKTGMMLGTPAYMSPEQIRSSKDTDARSDLWACGVLFYEMLTGSQAFPAPTEFARLTQILTAEPGPMQAIDPSLQQYAAFVQRALQKDRAVRFQSAQEMAQALSSLVAGRPATAAMAIPTPPPITHDNYHPAAFTPTAMTAVPITPSVTPSSVHPIPLQQPTAISHNPPAPDVAGTMNSPGGMRPSSRPPPQVVMVEQRRGVAPLLVVLLVLLAVALGFFLGFVAGRM